MCTFNNHNERRCSNIWCKFYTSYKEEHNQGETTKATTKFKTTSSTFSTILSQPSTPMLIRGFAQYTYPNGFQRVASISSNSPFFFFPQLECLYITLSYNNYNIAIWMQVMQNRRPMASFTNCEGQPNIHFVTILVNTTNFTPSQSSIGSSTLPTTMDPSCNHFVTSNALKIIAYLQYFSFIFFDINMLKVLNFVDWQQWNNENLQFFFRILKSEKFFYTIIKVHILLIWKSIFSLIFPNL